MKTIKIFLLTVSAAGSVIFFSYHLAYAQKVIPGVKIASISVGNKTPAEVQKILRERQQKLETQPLRLIAPSHDFSYQLEELGLSYHTEQTVVNALKVGRSGNIVRDIKDEIRTWIKGIEIDPVLITDEEKFEKALATIKEEMNDPPSPARFEIDSEAKLQISKAKDGQVVDEEALKEELVGNLKKFSGQPLTLKIKKVEPELTRADLERVKEDAERIISAPPKLTHQNLSWQPTTKEVLDLLEIRKEDSKVTIKTKRNGLENYIKKIARQINREPKGDVFRLEGGRVIEFRIAENGLELDEEKTIVLLSDALLHSKQTIELPVNVVEPQRSANDYGIKDLLGRGVSNFAGSSRGRIHNITNAAERLKGILVAPGEVFSFNKSLGEVSAATGYDQAYIISRGRTILGTGGGVCQVSTTVFRAAFSSGLEILKRTAHAYRVHYYEPPIGFDATVYAPAPDLVFKNDTDNYILIWSYVDLANTTLAFEIYGTSDGRTTEMIGPFVTNETPPPPPRYQEDPTLPKGVTKQVDWAAWGADASLGRKVYRNGKVIHEDTFYSHFQPWRAVYLVGTKET